MHDKLYDLGFTEAAGNFQQNNFTNGGTGGDRVIAWAQYGANVPGLRNNAFFYCSGPDGTPGYLKMYIYDL